MGDFCHQVARVGIEPFRRVISGYLRIHIKTSCLGKLFKNSSWQVESVQHLASLMLSLEMWRMNEKMILEGGLLQQAGLKLQTCLASDKKERELGF